MNIFKKTSFTWRQIGMLKLCLILVGIVIGARWPQVFAPYSVLLLIVAIILGIYLWTVWAKE